MLLWFDAEGILKYKFVNNSMPDFSASINSLVCLRNLYTAQNEADDPQKQLIGDTHII